MELSCSRSSVIAATACQVARLEELAFSTHEWVGLTAYHDDTDRKSAINTLPVAGELATMLMHSGSEDFYASYAVGRNKPLVLQTSAFYSPASGGAANRDIKTAWRDQALDTSRSGRFDRIAAVVWDERTSTRDTGVASIDWRLTGDAGGAVATPAARRRGGRPGIRPTNQRRLPY